MYNNKITTIKRRIYGIGAVYFAVETNNVFERQSNYNYKSLQLFTSISWKARRLQRRAKRGVCHRPRKRQHWSVQLWLPTSYWLSIYLYMCIRVSVDICMWKCVYVATNQANTENNSRVWDSSKHVGNCARAAITKAGSQRNSWFDGIRSFAAQTTKRVVDVPLANVSHSGDCNSNSSNLNSNAFNDNNIEQYTFFFNSTHTHSRATV